MKASILRHDSSREYWFKEGCFITELSNSPDDEALSIALVRVKPGATTRWHALDGIAERYVIRQGTGMVEVGDMPRQVSRNDVVLIPPGCRQRISNTGSEDLVFLALCTPRFQVEAYKDIE